MSMLLKFIFLSVFLSFLICPQNIVPLLELEKYL